MAIKPQIKHISLAHCEPLTSLEGLELSSFNPCTLTPFLEKHEAIAEIIAELGVESKVHEVMSGLFHQRAEDGTDVFKYFYRDSGVKPFDGPCHHLGGLDFAALARALGYDITAYGLAFGTSIPCVSDLGEWVLTPTAKSPLGCWQMNINKTRGSRLAYITPHSHGGNFKAGSDGAHSITYGNHGYVFFLS
jgi:hypothetical protein